ncbi:MAG: hypothetical protein AAF797_04710 [Planctomycetota bacterium]
MAGVVGVGRASGNVWLGGLCVLAGLMCVGVGVAVAHPGDEPLPVPEHAKDTTVLQWMGVWEGKWDGRWSVRFTVKDGAELDADQVLVIYEWEERLGAPWRRREFVGRLKEGVLYLGFIELYMSPESRVKGTAIGRFRHERAAELRKRPVQDQEGEPGVS